MPTQIRENQIFTRGLFSVKQILLSRGFEVTKESTKETLLITEENTNDKIWEIVFNVFNDFKLRTELKNFMYFNKKEVTSTEVTEIIAHSNFIRERGRFDNTLEWFAGELMIKRFAAFSASFGVTVRDIMRNSTATPAGDYDSLVVLRNTNLAYFECKAGSFDDTALMKCYERMLSLNCEYSILICVEKINEEKVIWDSSKVKIPVINGHILNKIFIKGKDQDIIYDLHNCYIIDLSNNIEDKIRTILRVNAAKINQLHFYQGVSNDIFNKLGYEVQTLDNQRY